MLSTWAPSSFLLCSFIWSVSPAPAFQSRRSTHFKLRSRVQSMNREGRYLLVREEISPQALPPTGVPEARSGSVLTKVVVLAWGW